MKKVTVYAPAKINLYLDVLGKRSDGYHDIESVMQSVSLADIVDVELTNGETELSVSDPELTANETNIAHKACTLFFSRTGINCGAKIHLEKRIPLASGLAGGSTDAGAVLRALNELCDFPLSETSISELALSLGADVPFCMAGGCAVCRGIGEKLEMLLPMTPFTVVIARGGAGVSTPEAYSLLDRRYGDSLALPFADINKVTDAIKENSIEKLSSAVFNTFEEVILPIHTQATLYRKVLLENGALTAMMSGSGPAVFGIFDDTEKADYAHHYLYSLGARSYVCTAK